MLGFRRTKNKDYRPQRQAWASPLVAT